MENFKKHEKVAKQLVFEMEERHKKSRNEIENIKYDPEIFHPSREYIETEKKVLIKICYIIFTR
jgi:hypothetical protein